MEARDPIQAHVEVSPRTSHGVNFPERYLKVTNEVVRQGQRSLISISDAGHHPFALLVAVDALISEFGRATLDREGITRRKDESGWHRDEVLAALAALHLRLDRERKSDADHNQVASTRDTSTIQ
jgi:hypothetical protein